MHKEKGTTLTELVAITTIALCSIGVIAFVIWAVHIANHFIQKFW